MHAFSYYDTVANLVPGLVFLWAAQAIGPLDAAGPDLIVMGNAIVDPLLVLAVAYVLGHVLQFLSKWTIEPLLKRVYWGGRWFSDVFLISAEDRCSPVELERNLAAAVKTLGFKEADLAVLRDLDVAQDAAKMEEARSLSHAIYRAADASTIDSGTAKRGHEQNSFYSLFRGLSLLFAMVAVMDLVPVLLGPERARFGLLLVVSLGLAIVFFIRARERGELYVRGIFWGLGHTR